MLAIGFDSGGTHTSYAMRNGDGPVAVVAAETASSIADARSARATEDAAEWITEIIAQQGCNEICAWIGAAGFAASTQNEIEELFRRPLTKLRSRLDEEDRHCDLFIANDAVSILKAPPLLGMGLAAIVGTGSVVMGAHPSCVKGVIRRGGHEWVVSDQGSGVWMTIQCVRLILRDIQERGSKDYHSALLDRLGDFLGIARCEVPASHRALAKADLIARRIADSRPDTKKFMASFVHPHIFDLASLEPGKVHDPIASEVLNASVDVMVDNIRAVADTLAASTADEPDLREALPLVIGGSIAANPFYDQRLRAEIASRCRFVSSISAIGDGGETLAQLALYYLRSNDRTKRALAKSFDPFHTVLKLL